MPEISSQWQNFYQILADEERLKILGLLAWQEHNAIDLAACLQSKPAQVLHHLEKVCIIGVVTIHREQTPQIYRCNSSALRDALNQLAASKKATPAEHFTGDEWERKIF